MHAVSQNFHLIMLMQKALLKIPTVCITNTTEPNIRTLKENLLSKYCKI